MQFDILFGAGDGRRNTNSVPRHQPAFNASQTSGMIQLCSPFESLGFAFKIFRSTRLMPTHHGACARATGKTRNVKLNHAFSLILTSAIYEWMGMKLRTVTVLFGLLFIAMQTAAQPHVYDQTIDPQLQSRLSKLEDFLVNQFNATVGLVRESPDNSIGRDYWLLSDNLIVMHVLAKDHPEIAERINQTLQKFGIFTDGLHEALFGATIPLPPYTPIVKMVENDSYVVKVEVRSNETGKLQPDWTEYADLSTYAALSAHNTGEDQLAIYYFNRALQMWNGAGLWDLPTQEDGFYSTYKLALLMYAADVLNQTIPYRATLEDRVWLFQREDGGIRSFYLGNLTSNREANSETAGLVLLAYQYKIQKDILQANRQAQIIAEQEAEARAQLMEKIVIVAVAGLVVSLIVL